MADILDDLKKRLQDLGFVDPKIELVISQIRTDWGGERPYIAVKVEAERRMSERNRKIIREFKDGESVTLLARRYGISRQRIWRIING
jgi:Mor family transcriptional regulator